MRRQAAAPQTPDVAPCDDALLRGIFPDSYFVNTPGSERVRHCRMLRSLREGDVQMEFHHHATGRFTELTLCAFDDHEPGLLAKVSGALSSLGIDVRTAFIYTIEAKDVGEYSPADEGRRIAFDILFLSRRRYRKHDRALSEEAVQRTREALQSVLSGTKSVAFSLRRTLRRPAPPLRIDDLTISNEGGAARPFTKISLCAAGSDALLPRATAALASFGLDIRIAQINTQENSVADVFYVTGLDGKPLPEGELASLAARLQNALENRSASSS